MNAASDQADKITEAGTRLYQELSRSVKVEIHQFAAEADQGGQTHGSDTAQPTA